MEQTTPTAEIGGPAPTSLGRIPAGTRLGRYLLGDAIGEGGAGVVYSAVGSSRVDLQACKLEYSIVSPK